MRYATTLVPGLPEWSARTEEIRAWEGRRAAFFRLARHRGPAILNGAVDLRAGYLDLLAAAVLRRRGRAVLLTDATWEPGSRRLDGWAGVERPVGHDAPPRSRRRVRRGLMRLIDGPRTHYVVLSSDELQTFPRQWGVDPERVHFVPFCATAEDATPVMGAGEGVFAGGNSLRDYRALLEAAPSIDASVTVATTLPLPPTEGVVAGPLSPAEYERRSASAAVAVVPLRSRSVRSAGQQTYLSAMLRGQAVVVTEAPGVRDYVRDGETGLVVPNEPRALAAAVNGLLDDPGRRTALGQTARADVLQRFRKECYFAGLLEVAGSAFQG